LSSIAMIIMRRFASSLSSRNHLEYAGNSGVSIAKRFAEAQESRAKQAMQHATDYLMPKQLLEAREEHVRSKLRSSRRGRDSLVESSIQQALASGELENLAGQGQPLARREECPFEKMSGMAVAHRILRSAGCAPAWVESNKRVRQGLHVARSELFEAWLDSRDASLCSHHSSGNAPAEAPMSSAEPIRWGDAVATFEERVRELNKEIARYNLIVPAAWQQMAPYRARRELERAIEAFDAVISDAEAARLRQLAQSRRQARRGHRVGHDGFLFGLGASFAMSDASMPSMFGALVSVLGVGERRSAG